MKVPTNIRLSPYEFTNSLNLCKKTGTWRISVSYSTQAIDLIFKKGNENNMRFSSTMFCGRCGGFFKVPIKIHC